jgi:uncharacterized membrane protein
MPETISGLPLHPLVVHAAVVLLPLCAIGFIVLVLVPKLRRTYGWLVIGGLAVSFVFAFIAKESGETLANVMGLPSEHAQWGDRLVPISFGLLVVAAVWFWFVRKGATGVMAILLNVAGVALAVITLGATVLVGHSGAEAAWAGRYAAAAQPIPASTTSTASGNATSSTAIPKTLTLAVVAQHHRPKNCWAAISGNVYNLTSWIAQHPGGTGPIKRLCGTDGTSAFMGQHGGQGRPAQELARFLVGPLAK